MKQELLTRYPKLEKIIDTIEEAKNEMIKCYENGGKILLCGNGGSCADCDHIVGELMKGFLSLRPLSDEKKADMKKNFSDIDDNILDQLQCGLPAISLVSLSALNSAFCNDVDPELIYAQSVFGLGKPGDILIAMSTSGNAKNVAAAVKVARATGMKVIAFTGKDGGVLRDISDICMIAPENETIKIQELHLPIYHYLCANLENIIWDK